MVPARQLLLARVVADPGADRRERIGLADALVGLLVLAPGDVRDVAPGLGAERAGRLARRADQVLADEGVAPLVDDVPLVLVAEVAQRAQSTGLDAVCPRPHMVVSLTTQRQLLEQVELLERPLAAR